MSRSGHKKDKGGEEGIFRSVQGQKKRILGFAKGKCTDATSGKKRAASNYKRHKGKNENALPGPYQVGRGKGKSHF